jgi:hypothetical protein
MHTNINNHQTSECDQRKTMRVNVEWLPLGFGHNNEYKMAMQAATMAAVDQGIPKKFSISFLYTKRAKIQSEK